MKKNLVCSLAVGTMMLAACSNEELTIKSLGSETVYAVMPQEEGQSRTTLNGLQVVWSTDDAISVFAKNDDAYTNNEGKIQTGAGETDATFSVTIEGTEKVAAAYPYVSTDSYNGSVISMTMKNSYTYAENDISRAPMAALITDQDTPIPFKNAGALMALTVNNIPAGYNKAVLTSLGEQAITGACEITFDSNGNPTLKTASSETDKTITINFDAAQTLTSKTFYFPIPVANYTSLQLSISNDTETKILKTKALNAARSVRYKSTLTLDEVTGSPLVDATGATEATEKLASGNHSVNVTITEEETDPTIFLPASNEQTSLSFESIPTGKTVTIQATTEEVKVSEQVTISASSDENSNNSFNINLPNSTVTLKANGESATYNEVTSITAENTLIISKGVTVNTLTVKGGNIRIEGGKIETTITNENQKEIVYVIADQEDFQTYQTLSENIKQAITKIECTDDFIEVNSAEELYAASMVAKNITLGTSITIEADKPVNPTNGQTYDLNNHKVNVTEGTKDVFRIEQSDAKVTFKNGTIDNQNGQNYALSIRADNVRLTMENVTIPSNSHDCSLHKNGSFTGCNVTLTNCNFNGSVYLSNTDEQSANTLTITGGTFTSTKRNNIQLLNTNLTMSGATLKNEVTEQSYQANGNTGNNFSKPNGYCIAFTNTDGIAAKGSAKLSNNTYTIADTDGYRVFNQLNGATIDGETSIYPLVSE